MLVENYYRVLGPPATVAENPLKRISNNPCRPFRLQMKVSIPYLSYSKERQKYTSFIQKVIYFFF